MLYRIKFISDEVDGFVREVKIDSDATFLDLNHIILQSCGYPDDQMTSFYICNDEWERGQQITREDMGVGNADEDIYAMDEVRLSEFIEDEEQRLEFVFDPFADRCFFLDVKEIIPGENLKSHIDRYPCDVCHLCESRQEAETLARVWNESYEANGTNLY